MVSKVLKKEAAEVRLMDELPNMRHHETIHTITFMPNVGVISQTLTIYLYDCTTCTCNPTAQAYKFSHYNKTKTKVLYSSESKSVTRTGNKCFRSRLESWQNN